MKDFGHEFDKEAYLNKFNTMPRTLKNGVISLPYSLSLNVKKIDNYVEDKSTVEAFVNMIFKIKCTGLKNKEEIMNNI